MGLRNVTDVSMKIDTVVRYGWTTQPCVQKLNTAWQVQVAGSTVSVIWMWRVPELNWAWALMGVLSNLG